MPVQRAGGNKAALFTDSKDNLNINVSQWVTMVFNLFVYRSYNQLYSPVMFLSESVVEFMWKFCKDGFWHKDQLWHACKMI